MYMYLLYLNYFFNYVDKGALKTVIYLPHTSRVSGIKQIYGQIYKITDLKSVVQKIEYVRTKSGSASICRKDRQDRESNLHVT